jgi:hypothetical protein
MNREQLQSSLRAAAQQARTSKNITLTTDAESLIQQLIGGGVDRVFSEKSLPEGIERLPSDFRSRLEDLFSDQRDTTIDEKGLRDLIARICPGFYPFC